jgi:hypothetical protein
MKSSELPNFLGEHTIPKRFFVISENSLLVVPKRPINQTRAQQKESRHEGEQKKANRRG